MKSLLYLFRPCGPAYAIGFVECERFGFKSDQRERNGPSSVCSDDRTACCTTGNFFAIRIVSGLFCLGSSRRERDLPVLFLPHARGSGLVLSLVGVRGEWVEGERYGHLVELGRGRESGEVMPVVEGIDGGWEFIGKEGRGVSRGGRWDSISGRLLAMRDQLVMEAVVVENGRMHGCLWGRRETEREKERERVARVARARGRERDHKQLRVLYPPRPRWSRLLGENP